jgi:hypothetical protein
MFKRYSTGKTMEGITCNGCDTTICPRCNDTVTSAQLLPTNNLLAQYDSQTR